MILIAAVIVTNKKDPYQILSSSGAGYWENTSLDDKSMKFSPYFHYISRV